MQYDLVLNLLKNIDVEDDFKPKFTTDAITALTRHNWPGNVRELKNLIPVRDGVSDLYAAMKQISETGKGPEQQTPSAGCSIKWKNN